MIHDNTTEASNATKFDGGTCTYHHVHTFFAVFMTVDTKDVSRVGFGRVSVRLESGLCLSYVRIKFGG